MGRRIPGALLLLLACFLARVSPVKHTSYLGGKFPPAEKRQPGPSLHPAGEGGSYSEPFSPTFKIPASFALDPLGFLSRAPVDSLILLPGIGPVIAERIADARSGKGPFISWESLLAVKGIGRKKMADLKKLAGAAGTP